MNVKELSQKLDHIFEIQQAEDFDNVGLLCGNPGREVSGILVCHDALETVVDEALQRGCNFIVTFHPIIFSGLKKIAGKNYVERAVLKAIENRVAIYAVHTAFDNDYFGVNYGICEQLGLQRQQVLMPKTDNLMQLVVYVPTAHKQKVQQALFEAGAGNIGFYDECSFSVQGEGTFRPLEGSDPYTGEQNKRTHAQEEMLYVIFEAYKKDRLIAAMKASHPYEEVAYQVFSLENENQYSGLGRYGELEREMEPAEFLSFVKEKFGLQLIRHAAFPDKKIKRVGVLGGSGASGLQAVLAAGCDAYLTGDLKYHDFFAADHRLLLCDIGHFESEQYVTQQLVERLSEKFPTFAILKSTTNTNPVNYFF